MSLVPTPATPARSLGRRAKVELAGGAMVSVRPEHVSEITA